MKYFIMALYLFCFIGLHAQEAVPENKTEESESIHISNDGLLEGDKSEENNYREFNERKTFLLNNGLNSNQLHSDQKLNGFMSSNFYQDSYPSNMMKYWMNGKNIYSASHLLKAYEINPNDTDSYDEMLELSNWMGNDDLEKEIAFKIKNSNKYDSGIYSYSKDLLNSIPANSVLITNGEVETMSGRVIQLTEGNHSSVKIIRKDWLEEGRYTKARLNEIGLIYDEGIQSASSKWEFLARINPSKRFFVSLTLPESDFKPFMSHLFLTGLSFEYSSTPLSNLTDIENNWNKVYLKRDFKNPGQDYFSKNLLSNYLLSGIKLYTYYQKTGQSKKAKELKQTLKTIAEKCGQLEKLKAWL